MCEFICISKNYPSNVKTLLTTIIDFKTDDDLVVPHIHGARNQG